MTATASVEGPAGKTEEENGGDAKEEEEEGGYEGHYQGFEDEGEKLLVRFRRWRLYDMVMVVVRIWRHGG